MEREKRRFFDHVFKIGKEQTQKFLFAHTYHGSFGFTIESPIEATLFQDDPKPPIARKIVERITRGLLTVKQAEQIQNASAITENYETGLNANMCTAAVDMLSEVQGVRIEYSVNWSARLQAPTDIAHIPAIALERSSSIYLGQAAKQLEDLSQELEDKGEQLVAGEIVNLASRDGKRGSVTFVTTEYGNVHMVLNKEAYQVACDAHRDRRTIQVRGYMTKRQKQKTWELTNPHELKVL
jgi:hypothetical protein